MSKKSEYNKNYKEYHYKKVKRIITFPVLVDEHKKLEEYAKTVSVTTNTLAKNIVLNFLNGATVPALSEEQKRYANEYMRISRGIANNINQLAKSSNIGNHIDVNLVITELMRLENAFNSYIKNK
jgi:hypothetical protein